MPRCYFSDSDSEAGDYAVLMEDLGRGRLVDDAHGFSEREAEAIVEAIAVFHAKMGGEPIWNRRDGSPCHLIEPR
jgi:hypothetical protein